MVGLNVAVRDSNVVLEENSEIDRVAAKKCRDSIEEQKSERMVSKTGVQ